MMRYPGAKGRQSESILKHIPHNIDIFSEPFCGTSAISLRVAKRQYLKRLHLNDLDVGIYSLWQSIYRYPQSLISMVMDYTPSPESFYIFKSRTMGDDQLIDGFAKLALHQISYSGLGNKAGSPIGGRHQLGKYKVDCRWNPEKIASWINASNRVLRSCDEVIITNENWTKAVDGFLYLDPPYYNAGSKLYKHGTIDHKHLAEYLSARDSWVLSYDDCPAIRELYKDSNIILSPTKSSIKPSNKDIVDVIIVPPERGKTEPQIDEDGQ